MADLSLRDRVRLWAEIREHARDLRHTDPQMTRQYIRDNVFRRPTYRFDGTRWTTRPVNARVARRRARTKAAALSRRKNRS